MPLSLITKCQMLYRHPWVLSDSDPTRNTLRVLQQENNEEGSLAHITHIRRVHFSHFVYVIQQEIECFHFVWQERVDEMTLIKTTSEQQQPIFVRFVLCSICFLPHSPLHVPHHTTYTGKGLYFTLWMSITSIHCTWTNCCCRTQILDVEVVEDDVDIRY